MTREGGESPTWRRSGAELKLIYQRQADFYEVGVGGSSSPQISPATRVGNIMELGPRIEDADWLLDGRLVAVLKGDDEKPPRRINVVLNWDEELARRLGP